MVSCEGRVIPESDAVPPAEDVHGDRDRDGGTQDAAEEDDGLEAGQLGGDAHEPEAEHEDAHGDEENDDVHSDLQNATRRSPPPPSLATSPRAASVVEGAEPRVRD